ncbi:hypothetical protein CAPTEDRAFT_151542 [Capitella teleta]|uniref:Zinc finger matrin-type protein 5 n=1 Tax=Capitella teleta TaxID=283909 RepID=R7TYG8_CAPTE|nr:hypothetical protein CAPTEDRAFT_151542 [Capitella teleta]|eukprot:ELT98779.1 hypothetical protein CAPTEDRAFT_151542 [Capitella teleta]
MGRRYFCEYCDKAFPDNPTQRKKHIHGVHHQRMRKAHYDSFRDPSVILQEEMQKPPCRNFFNRGHCDYINNCRFSHLTEEYKLRLQEQAKLKKGSAAKPADSATLDEWLAKRSKSTTSDDEAKETPPPAQTSFSLPPHLLSHPNLPPSLLPPPPDAFQLAPLAEWG